MSFGDSRERPSLLPELSYDQLKKKKKRGNALMSLMSSLRLKIRAHVSPAECLSPETNSFHVIRAFFILSARFVEFKVS